MKTIKLLGILLLALVALTGTAMAADYEVASLEVNGESPSGLLHVEPGQKLVVHVNVKGLSADPKDVTMKVWLGGYEYGLVQATTDMFMVRQDVTYQKYVVLELPDDLNTNSNDYTLHVELYDANDVVEEEFPLFVEEARHNLQIQDVILVPNGPLEAGKVMYAKVRVENMGYKKEEDIKVQVSIPQLGASASTYIDELYPRNEDDNSQSANTLYLTLPKDAKSGDYELSVKVTYDRGHKSLEATKMVYVEGQAVESKAESKAIVSVQTNPGKFMVGTEKPIRIAVANMGSKSQVYTVEVLGTALWAETRVEPPMLSVSDGSTGEFLVKLIPTEMGNHQFTIRVKEGDLVVKEKNLSVSVDEKTVVKEVSNKLPFDKDMLLLIGGVVLLIIVVFVILSQFQGDKVSKKDLQVDDSTYYQRDDGFYRERE